MLAAENRLIESAFLRYINSMCFAEPVRIGLIGAGRIGTAHAATLVRHVPGARLIAIADPRPGAAEAIATLLGVRAATDPANLFSDPEIEAVVIAASSSSHTRLILAAIAAGKAAEANFSAYGYNVQAWRLRFRRSSAERIASLSSVPIS